MCILSKSIYFLSNLFSFHLNSSNGDIGLYYTNFKDPTTLANSLWKLRKGYYEEIDQPLNVIIPTKYRTVEFTVQAALSLMEAIECDSFIKDPVALKMELTALAQDTKHALLFLERDGEIPDSPEFVVDMEAASIYPTKEEADWPNFSY
jgi:hypothetical protein